MKAIVDVDTCVGCGLCVSACPEVFKFEGDKVAVIGTSVPKNAEASCQQAVSDCPVTAIMIQ
jgi:ferredoxin